MKKPKKLHVGTLKVDPAVMSLEGVGETTSQPYEAKFSMSELGYASAAGAASGAYRLLDLLSVDAISASSRAEARDKARKLLIMALFQCDGATRALLKREAKLAALAQGEESK